MFFRLAVLAAAALFVARGLVPKPPPQDGLPLSRILGGLEDAHDIRAFTEVEWNRAGYWEIELITRDRRRVELRIDPHTGQQWEPVA